MDKTELMNRLRAAHAAGDTEAARRFAAMAKEAEGSSSKPKRDMKAITEAETAKERERLFAEQAQENSTIDNLLIGAGRGFMNIGRGLGIVDPAEQYEQDAYAALTKEAPVATTIGEVAGETAPFIIPGMAAGRIASTGKRVGAMAGLGAAQAGTASVGRGEGSQNAAEAAGVGGAIAGAAELAMPHVMRVGSQIVRRLTGGAPKGALIDEAGNLTPEMRSALERTGITENELVELARRNASGENTEDIIAFIGQQPAGAHPDQVARAAVFKAEGVPYSRGDITTDYTDLSREASLAELTTDPNANRFREHLAGQSGAIRNRLEGEAARLGAPDAAGETVQAALQGQNASQRGLTSAKYNEAALKAKELGGVPIDVTTLKEALPDEIGIRNLRRDAGADANRLEGILIDYGIKEAPKGHKDVVTPLSVENFEEFRQALNGLRTFDKDASIKGVASKIIEAADGALNSIIETGDDLGQTLRDARLLHKTRKEEFSPNALAGRLISVKPDGVTPLIESSQVIPRLLSKSTPIEQLTKTMGLLSKNGEQGKAAIGNLQAATLMELTEAAFANGSHRVGEQILFAPGAFKKAVDKIGKDKLNVIFSGNQEALRTLENFAKIAEWKQIPTGAAPKGSATKLTDLFNSLGGKKIPFTGVIGDLAQQLGSLGKVTGDVNKALAARPDIMKPETIQITTELAERYPVLFQAIGGTDNIKVALLAESARRSAPAAAIPLTGESND